MRILKSILLPLLIVAVLFAVTLFSFITDHQFFNHIFICSSIISMLILIKLVGDANWSTSRYQKEYSQSK